MANTIVFPNTFFTTSLDPTSDRVMQKKKEIHGDVDFVRADMLASEWWTLTTIATASVLTLNTVPVVLVAAPGSGMAIFVDDIVASYVYNTTTYACNASGASLFYKSDGSGQALGITLTQAFIQSSSGTNFSHVRGNSTAITDATAAMANQPVVIKAATSDPTTGNGAIKIFTRYRVLPVPF